MKPEAEAAPRKNYRKMPINWVETTLSGHPAPKKRETAHFFLDSIADFGVTSFQLAEAMGVFVSASYLHISIYV